MKPSEDPSQPDEIPMNWDVLHEPAEDDGEPIPEFASSPDSESAPPIINVLASSWADAVAVLAVCTAALVGLNAVGNQITLGAFPWAMVLGFSWWVFAAAALVTIRQGTPGMLLAGIHFSALVPPRRVALVLVAAIVSAVMAGLPGLLGAHRSPLALAAGSALEPIPVD